MSRSLQLVLFQRTEIIHIVEAIMNATVEARVVALMQRARKALRIYASVERTPGDSANAEFVELQAREWRSANEQLLRRLAALVDRGLASLTIARIATIQAEFASELATTRAEYEHQVVRAHDSLARANFVQAAIETRSLVGMKARLESLLAIEQEFATVLRGVRVPEDGPAGVREELGEGMPVLAANLSSEVLGARLRGASARKLQVQTDGEMTGASAARDDSGAIATVPQRGRVLPFRGG